MARIERGDIRSIVDLGCGDGALLPFLRRRWPAADLTGVDLSPAMLEAARAVDPELRLVEADAASWRPASPVDLIFSNAALHWVADHDRLLPELLSSCGMLAVQMPHNDEAPSHRLLRELAAEPPWRDRLGPGALARHVQDAAAYLRLLELLATRVEIWETIYYQSLTGSAPVLEWVRGTTLLPVYRALGGRQSPLSRAFEEAYAARLAAAYPADERGVTLFPFRRLFLIAER
jgi:trans-aconitate 2-methyltransferase